MLLLRAVGRGTTWNTLSTYFTIVVMGWDIDWEAVGRLLRELWLFLIVFGVLGHTVRASRGRYSVWAQPLAAADWAAFLRDAGALITTGYADYLSGGLIMGVLTGSRRGSPASRPARTRRCGAWSRGPRSSAAPSPPPSPSSASRYIGQGRARHYRRLGFALLGAALLIGVGFGAVFVAAPRALFAIYTEDEPTLEALEPTLFTYTLDYQPCEYLSRRTPRC